MSRAAAAARFSSRSLTPVNGQRDSLRLAAIDIGSNSLHMIVAQADGDGGVTTLWRMKEMVGLGRMSFPSRRLTKNAIDAALASLARFVQAARQRQCEKIVAVATSAIREAHNGGEFIERAKGELGIPVRVVSAREEARLIYLAVRHAIDLGDRPRLIVDIGGGSVEIIVGDADRALLLESRKLGAARMTAKFVRSDPLSGKDRKALLRHYDKELSPLIKSIETFKPAQAIGTSGTLENIASMCAAAAGGASGRDRESDGEGIVGVIERKRFGKVLDRLLDSRSKDRATIPGLGDQRKDQITAGALLANEFFKRLDLKRIDLCGSALREGILIDYLSRHMPDLAIRREVPDPRRRSVIDLARRCHWHRTHSEQVARLCMRLFDDLRPLHGLGAAERELIEYAALLHDIGWHIGGSGHHKHSMYLILNGNLHKNFTPDEVRIIASVARYHRKSLPTRTHAEYTSLPRRARRVVDVGASLLRMADGLDRSHGSVVQDLKCRAARRDRKNVRCIVSVRSDAELELWAARLKMDLFAKVFGKQIKFAAN